MGEGNAQSPIDLAGDVIEESYDHEALTITGAITNSKIKIKNDGHTLKVSLPDGLDVIFSGANLIGNYRLAQYHFHWESEHTYKGERFDLEVHFVHYNTKYASLGAALDHADGLAVVGVFFKATDNDAQRSMALDKVTAHFNDVEDAGSEKTVDATSDFPLMGDFLSKTEKYIRYTGSLTTPPCNEVVAWTVMDPVNDPVYISQTQLDAFHHLKGFNGKPITGIKNFRDLQPLNGRAVKSYERA